MILAQTLPFIFDEEPARATRSRQSDLGQFFTPPQIADFMANMFSPPTRPVSLLDAGAGEGALSTAFVARWRATAEIRIDAFELDNEVVSRLCSNLKSLAQKGVHTELHHNNFLRLASEAIRSAAPPKYTRAIMNPPYRKISTLSAERTFASLAGLETVNLYTAFVGLALELMIDDGEIVAIIPRSFCNGPYYRPFRDWMLQRAAIRQIHLFHSRRDAFAGADVLQENVIIHLVRGARQSDVVVSTSNGRSFDDLEKHIWPFDVIVRNDDPAKVIHIPTSNQSISKSRFDKNLTSTGLDVSTGPIVGFRLLAHLREQYSQNDAPLIYPQHLKYGEIEWPIQSKKPNAISLNIATRKWMFPRGWYVAVKRFSSKEERRRVVAALCDPKCLPGMAFGFENKLNIIHLKKNSLDELLARGMTIFLNSTSVDEEFRLFSGHTQVNAADLRAIKFPDLDVIRNLGTRWSAGKFPPQETIDDWVSAL